ncbi:hypothetical protein GCM10025762_53390 [Haloechinothrix salitolerans]
MKTSRYGGVVASVASLAVVLAGCGSGADTTDAASSSVTVEHAMGTAEVPCTPQRVVTLGQGQTDTTLALGVTPVGVVKPWTDDWYDYLPDEVEEAKVLGTELEPDLEAIAALNPDVILGSKLRHEALYEQLSRIAPTVFSETIGVAWKDNVYCGPRHCAVRTRVSRSSPTTKRTRSGSATDSPRRARATSRRRWSGSCPTRCASISPGSRVR